MFRRICTRPRLVWAAIVATIAVVGISTLPALAAAAPGFWTMSEGDAGHSNRTSNETILSSTSVTNLLPDYSLATTPGYGECGGTMDGGPTDIAPLSNGSLLFYFDGRRVVAADLTTGVRKWAFQVTDKFADDRAWSLALSGNTLLVNEIKSCDSSSDPDSLLIAFNAKTGAQIWQQFVDPVIGAMVVSGTTIVYDAFDAAQSVVEARSITSGALIWSAQDCFGPYQRFSNTPGSRATGPFVVGTTVTAVCGSNQVGLNLTTGARKWTKTGITFFRGDGPSITNPQIYINTGAGTAGHLQALTAAGAVVWTSPTETGPVLAAGPTRIYVSCDAGALCALNRTTGVRLWKDAADHPTTAILADDVVYPIPATAPLNAATGAAIDQQFGIGPFLSSASAAQVSNGRLIVESGGRIIDVYTLG